MPKGCFLIAVQKNSEMKIVGNYTKDKKEIIKISDDLLLRIQMNHATKEISKISFKDVVYFSYIHEYPSKLKKNVQVAVIGIFLSEDEDPKPYISSLQNAAKSLENIEIESLKSENRLEDIYKQFIEKLKDIFDPEHLKSTAIDTAKNMLSGSSKDRKNAQELLKKIEEGIHTKIHKSGKSAEDAMKIGDYEKAVKEYERAAGLALEIFDNNLAKSLKDRALIAKKVPNITKERNKAINNARSSLRNEDFHSAYLNFRKAAELSEKLMDFEKAEEYSLKSKALSDFHSVDKKFKKK